MTFDFVANLSGLLSPARVGKSLGLMSTWDITAAYNKRLVALRLLAVFLDDLGDGV